MRIYKENDLSRNRLEGATVAVLGYGTQGHAHALNLRDSGLTVVVGARPGGGGWKRAERDGFTPRAIPDAVRGAAAVAVLLPDEVQGETYASEIAPNLSPGAALVFAHGFAIAFGAIEPPKANDVVLVAPKGQGHYVRRLYVEGRGLPCLVAVESDASGQALDRALSYAGALGCLRAGAIETTFREEAITDLFGEQVVLCGGVPALITSAFDTLVKNGYQPEVAYLECLHELKIITDLVHRGGLRYMRERISRTAAWGSFVTGKRLVGPELEATMQSVLESIESGRFADEWRAEAGDGAKRLREYMEREATLTIERVGGPVRALMPYLEEQE